MITNVNVWGLDESLKAAQFPMLVDTKNAKEGLHAIHSTLGHAKNGSGHDCFLKGIIVQADIRAPEYFWAQFGRYSFADIVSSQSKMHKLTKVDLSRSGNEFIHSDAIRVFESCRDEYLKTVSEQCDEQRQRTAFQQMVANCPMGYERVCRVTTNYLQLKTMYFQRKSHKLVEWREFCKWCESLPLFSELVL